MPPAPSGARISNDPRRAPEANLTAIQITSTAEAAETAQGSLLIDELCALCGST